MVLIILLLQTCTVNINTNRRFVQHITRHTFTSGCTLWGHRFFAKLAWARMSLVSQVASAVYAFWATKASLFCNKIMDEIPKMWQQEEWHQDIWSLLRHMDALVIHLEYGPNTIFRTGICLSMNEYVQSTLAQTFWWNAWNPSSNVNTLSCSAVAVCLMPPRYWLICVEFWSACSTFSLSCCRRSSASFIKSSSADCEHRDSNFSQIWSTSVNTYLVCMLSS